jgi:lactate permease
VRGCHQRPTNERGPSVRPADRALARPVPRKGILVFHQIYDPVHGSLGLSTVFAVLPLLTVFLLLGVLKMRAQWAALIALAVAIAVAVVVYHMPAGQALSGGAEGVAFGLFPIMWIVVNAIWIYSMTVTTGHFDVLRRSFGKVSEDQRIQAIIIAFCFGALLEALAGFGTPVAITSVMLIALGFPKLKAAAVALVANTAPVAFGALGVPITTLAKVTALPEHALASTVGRQTPVLALFVPLALVFMVDGRRGIRQTWPAAASAGVVFAVVQFVSSNFISLALTDILASLAAAVSIVALLRVWKPVQTLRGDALSEEQLQAQLHAATASAHSVELGSGRATAGSVTSNGRTAIADTTITRSVSDDRTAVALLEAAGPQRAGYPPATPAPLPGYGTSGEPKRIPRDSRAQVVRAYAPYLIIIAVFSLAQLSAVKRLLAKGIQVFAWPGLHIRTPSGKVPSAVSYSFGWLPAGGTLLLLAGLITMLVLRIGFTQARRDYVRTLVQLKWAILTVAAVLALAYVMNLSGQTITIGTWMAGAGGLFALLSPILGWLGVAVTGSDTSSNALFGTLQVSAAHSAHLPPVLLAAANSAGGVLGKMISPQNLAIAAASVGLAGGEGELFRKIIVWTVAFLAFMSLLVYLQSTGALSWMLP